MAQIIVLPYYRDADISANHQEAVQCLNKTNLVTRRLDAAMYELNRDPTMSEFVVLDFGWLRRLEIHLPSLDKTNVSTVPMIIVYSGNSDLFSGGLNIVGKLPIEAQTIDHLSKFYNSLGDLMSQDKGVTRASLEPILAQVYRRCALPKYEVL